MSWDGNGPMPTMRGRCRPSCCKGPYGHITARDGLADWRWCKCHDVVPEPAEESLVRLRDPFDGNDAA